MKIIAYLGLIVLLAQDNLFVNCAFKAPKTRATTTTQVRSTAVPIAATTTQALSTPSDL